MKWKAIIVLAAIALAISVPPSLQLIIVDDNVPSFMTLKVCQASVPALSSSDDMPCVQECPCRLCPSLSIELCGLNEPFHILTPASHRHYHPPRISA